MICGNKARCSWQVGAHPEIMTCFHAMLSARPSLGTGPCAPADTPPSVPAPASAALPIAAITAALSLPHTTFPQTPHPPPPVASSGAALPSAAGPGRRTGTAEAAGAGAGILNRLRRQQYEPQVRVGYCRPGPSDGAAADGRGHCAHPGELRGCLAEVGRWERLQGAAEGRAG